MWILDAGRRKDVELWVRDGGRCRKITEEYRPRFRLHLPDEPAHLGMIEALVSEYGAEECVFETIHGELGGYSIPAGREVAEAIERQSRFSAKLFDVDTRVEQRFMAERGVFPFGEVPEDRFSPEMVCPVRALSVEVKGNPVREDAVESILAKEDATRIFGGGEKTVLEDFSRFVDSFDPDVILMPDADLWMRHLVRGAERHGLDPPLTRSGRYSGIGAKSYMSYGRMVYRAGALMPEGRVLVDTSLSFNYNEGGLLGVLVASRLTGLSPNLASRFTPGTLISSYETYEAVRRGIAVPFRKSDPEETRSSSELRAMDRGGMMFQPEPGVYDSVHQIDFTSLYPSIIVNYNLSPESLADPGRQGFLSDVLRPLLELRYRTKRMKKEDPGYAGIDSMLKWMLVTSFGYTGYRNAKFGSIQVHERITSISRDILLSTKETAERMGFEVLHGIVDCLWVRGGDILGLKERVEGDIGIPTEVEAYDWIAFLRMSDGGGAYNRYFGRLSDGTVKMRGIAAKRRDSPGYVRRMQLEVLDEMCKAASSGELPGREGEARRIFERYERGLRTADPREMVINYRIGSIGCERNCAQASAVRAYRRMGAELAAGMMIGYVVRDAGRWIVDTEDEAREFDARHYSKLLRSAWAELSSVFDCARGRAESR